MAKNTTIEENKKEEKVPLTEEFQREVMSLLGEATKEECAFIRDCVYRREEELREEEEPTMEDYNKVKEAD